MLKAITLLTLSFLAIGISGSNSCHAQQNQNDKPVVKNQNNDSGELKTLAEGSQS